MVGVGSAGSALLVLGSDVKTICIIGPDHAYRQCFGFESGSALEPNSMGFWIRPLKEEQLKTRKNYKN
jgi:hypothetical protein